MVNPDIGSQASDAEKQDIYAAVSHIRARVLAGESYRDAVRPKPDSAEEIELRGWRGNHPGATAELLMVSVDFHLLTLAAALSHRDLYPFGGFTLLRGAAEPAARAAWIMDPDISAKDRRARVLVERLVALQEMRKFKNLRRQSDDRIGQLVIDAEALGHKPVNGKLLKPEHFGQPRPSATALFARLLPDAFDSSAQAPGDRLYRILSAFSHSTLWAVLAQRELVEEYRPGLKSAMVALNVDWLIGQLGQVLKLHSIAMRRLAGQIGEGPERWDRILRGLPSPTGSGRAPATKP